MSQPKDISVDLHVWIQPGSRKNNEFYTVSSGARAICISASQEEAMVAIENFLDNLLINQLA